ncbi:uncharacterized protein LOC118194644 [Stegodyphus dumicola]|uniref:uncharacterized protein LOC118194644 n=1 Tax=Stegodyphus dumicola TaxID=202533 RepID=UPI0015B10B9C|nr:uncharacterized protein LOC118194644 [Stegodyphus dumicola]
MMCKGFRTTATSAAIILAGIPPLYLRAEQEATITRVLQLRKDATFHDTTHSPTLYENPRPTQRPHPGIQGRNFRITIDNTSNSSIPNATYVYYTDGSKIEDGVGSAYICYHQNDEHTSWKAALRHFNSVFQQAEALAILNATNDILSNGYHQACICTDSQSSLLAIQNLSHTSPIISEIQKLLSVNHQQRIHLTWVKAHAGLVGNEAADTLAKEAAAISSEVQQIRIRAPPSHLKRLLKEDLLKIWQEEWNACDTGRRTYNLLPKVSLSRLIAIPQLTRFITGHGPYPAYYYRHNISTTDACVCGANQLGSPDHYIYSCPLTADNHIKHPTPPTDAFQRFIIKNKPAINKICKVIDQLAAMGQDICDAA